MVSVVNERNELTLGLPAPAGSRRSNGASSDAPMAYEAAVAEMEARAAAIAGGKRRELVWLLEHPPLYTAGTSAGAGDLLETRFPVSRPGAAARRPITARASASLM